MIVDHPYSNYICNYNNTFEEGENINQTNTHIQKSNISNTSIKDERQECCLCLKMIKVAVMTEHFELCSAEFFKDENEQDKNSECPHCNEYFRVSYLTSHKEKCENKYLLNDSDKEVIILGRKFQNESKEIINSLQSKAIDYVQEISEEKSNAAYPLVLKRFQKLNMSDEMLKRVLKYIAYNAPIIIHFNPAKVLNFFVNDTNYRNQFETGTSGGCLDRKARIKWEDRIFNNIYNKASDTDRVKYGVLNIVNDPFGVYSCSHYGDSYLVLNNETVRLRTTFASGDSCNPIELATCENYCHVLNTFSDKELCDLITVATNQSPCLSSKSIVQYKEVQIYGPIEFNHDVSALVMHSKHLLNDGVIDLSNKFCDKNGINLIWTD